MPGPTRAPACRVIGGGLAGCEAALQLARLGLEVVLREMRPARTTPAHRTGGLAEIVCSNSFKSTDLSTASGMLKAELDRLGCRLLDAARAAAVPGGSALAFDRDLFSENVERMIAAEPRIAVERGETDSLESGDGIPLVIATGPLTTPELKDAIGLATGRDHLHFYDAIAPTVTLESLDLDVLYRASRYDRGEADYLNSPLDEPTYHAFREELVAARRAEVHELDRGELFSGCQPLEEIAAGGPQSLAFGPLRPVGLIDPRTGRRPFAAVQLRQENREGTLYGLVGFQTRLAHGEQRRIFRMLPGLGGAEFVRLGQLHRNFYLDTPRCLDERFALPDRAGIRFAGQITGVEGYVESIASGLTTAWRLAADLRGIALPPWPPATMVGALLDGFLRDTTAARLVPMNANYGLLPPPERRLRDARARKRAMTERGLADLAAHLDAPPLRRLLA